MKSIPKTIIAIALTFSCKNVECSTFPFSVGSTWKYKSTYYKSRDMGNYYEGTSLFSISKLVLNSDSSYSVEVKITDSVSENSTLPFSVIHDSLSFLWKNGIGTNYSVNYRGRFLSNENRTGYVDTSLTGVFNGGYQYYDSYDQNYGTTLMNQLPWSQMVPGGFRYELFSMNGVVIGTLSIRKGTHISQSLSQRKTFAVNNPGVSITFFGKLINGHKK